MAIKLNRFYADKEGWGRVVEYGNIRLKEMDLENLKVTIKPANKEERKRFLKRGYSEEAILILHAEDFSEYLVISLTDKNVEGYDHRISNPDVLVDELIIPGIYNSMPRNNK